MKSHQHVHQNQEQLLKEELDDYLKQHLKEYVLYLLDQGYELKAIFDVLKHYGYTSSHLQQLLQILPKKEHTVREIAYEPSLLDEDTHYFLRNIIADYIKAMLDHGYSAQSIKKALLHYGHHPLIVNQAFDIALGKKAWRLHQDIIIPFVFVLYLFLTAILVLELSPSFIQGALFFTPGLFGLIVHTFFLNAKKIKGFAPLLTLFVVIFFFIGLVMLLLRQGFNLNDYDVDILLGINVFFAGIGALMMQMAPPRKNQQQQSKQKRK